MEGLERVCNRNEQALSCLHKSSALEEIALKAATVMSVLLLQRPFRSSKPKDHSACLERRMSIRKKGDIKNLLTEGLTLQKRLPKLGTPSNESNVARTSGGSRIVERGFCGCRNEVDVIACDVLSHTPFLMGQSG